MIARRAFMVSKDRGFVPGHEVEDWKRAESEVLRPLCGGWTVKDDDRLAVTESALGYKEGAIEVYVAPRRLTIFGKERTALPHNMLEEGRSKAPEKEIVRILDLPVEVDPSGATARFDHCMLEIFLPKVRSARGVGTEARAA
jgi:HSP20 family protein